MLARSELTSLLPFEKVRRVPTTWRDKNRERGRARDLQSYKYNASKVDSHLLKGKSRSVW